MKNNQSPKSIESGECFRCKNISFEKRAGYHEYMCKELPKSPQSQEGKINLFDHIQCTHCSGNWEKHKECMEYAKKEGYRLAVEKIKRELEMIAQAEKRVPFGRMDIEKYIDSLTKEIEG